MRLSLWQQFSSNHSASFTVVGTFESAEKANEAAAELRRILARIEKWWDALPPEKRIEWHDKDETSELTPPERELNQRYQVKWPFSINWYQWAWNRSQDSVTTFDQFVFVENPHYHIWHGPQPFDELMAQFGGIVAVDASESQSYPEEMLLLDVVCKLPEDHDTAAILYESFNEDFAVYRNSDNADDYSPNIGLPFNYDCTKTKFLSPTRVFEVERDEKMLYLYGIVITEGERLSKALPKFVEYLRREGCAEIRCSFRSSRRIRPWESP
ncbi:MAG: hypothetical protein ABI690_15535 [Chloroflexota bacterium]